MRLPAVVLVLGLCFSALLDAQFRYRPTEPGPWRPWSFTAIASARTARGATPAEVQAFQTRLQELGAIVRRAPAVAQPVGFAAELWGNLDGYPTADPGLPPGRAVPLAGGLSFGAFPLVEFMRNGKLMNEDHKGGETALLRFVVNQIGAEAFTGSKPVEWGGADIGFFEPAPGAPHVGLPRLADVFVLKRHDRPLWLPVPLADALAPVVAERRAQFENRRDVYARELAEFSEWQTPAKRAARRNDWQEAAKVLPNGAEFLANTEKTDREIEAMNRQRLAPGGPEAAGVQEAEQRLKEAEKALAGLSPAARTAPSCYDREAAALVDKFRTAAAGTDSCRALVKTNWTYFDAKLPRAVPQVLMIESFTRCLTRESLAETGRGGCVINRALLESLDWPSVRAWLTKP